MLSPREFRLAALVLAPAGLIACAAMTAMPEPPEGAALFAENCAVCHGSDGRGDGPLASDLHPAPPDLTAISARAGGTFPRAEVLSTIDGYTRGDKAGGPDMPEFGLLLRGETVPVDTGDGIMSPVPRPLAAILFYLESIQK